MLYTLSDARAECGRFVENGSCDTTLVNGRINQALERLLDEYPGSYEEYRIMRMTVCNQCFALPYNVESIISADINGSPVKIYGPSYQFLSSGVGDLDYNSGNGWNQDIVDRGESPVMYDIPKKYEDSAGTEHTPNGLKIAAFSTSLSDHNVEITVKGFNHTGENIYTGSSEGEVIKVQQWKGGVEGTLRGTWNDGVTLSTNEFMDVTRVVKPETVGYVCLYAIDTVTNSMFLLAKYHPSQTIAQFRRYRITNKSVGYMSDILLRVKLRFIPLASDDDILPIESLQAVKLAVMAIDAENARDMAGYQNLMLSAIRVMGKREAAKEEKGTSPTLNFDYRFSLGRKVNRSICM